MREKINIEKPKLTPDGSGGFTTEYELQTGPIWAEIMPAGGKEIFFAQKLQMNITHKITIRFESGIEPNMRVLFEGRIFKILAFHNRDERSRWLDLLCEEGAGD